MELVFFIAILIGVFFVMLYMPTVLLLDKKKRKSGDYESLLVFIAISMLFALVTYLFANFYLLKSEVLSIPISCEWLGNLNCLFNEKALRQLVPSFDIYLMIFMQLFVTFFYAFFTYKCVTTYKTWKRVLVSLALFFTVSFVATLTNLYLLNDVAFIGGIKYILLLTVNAYVMLPLYYLFIILYNNRDKIRRK